MVISGDNTLPELPCCCGLVLGLYSNNGQVFQEFSSTQDIFKIGTQCYFLELGLETTTGTSTAHC